MSAVDNQLDLASPKARVRFERGIHVVLLACAGVSVLSTVGIVVVLLVESLKFFADLSVVEFLTGTRWSPVIKPTAYGVLPLICGTLLVAGGAAVVAAPIGLGTAIFLSEYATPWFRDLVKPVLEILAGIPSVVYGYLAVVTITPWLKSIFPSTGDLNAASASIVVGIMVLPMIVSLSEDVLRSVPRSLREGAYALGATKFDVTVRVVVPAALSGIIASFLLAISRAIGETMAVTLAAGIMPKMTLNPLDAVQTMTGFIASMVQGENPAGTTAYQTLYAVGLTLFISTLSMNLLSQWILARMRNKYE